MSGLTTLSGIIVLTGARAINTTKGNRQLLLNANIYADDSYTENPSTGLLQFFNENDIPLSIIDPLFINGSIHFAQPPPSLPQNLLPDKFSPHDYAFIGNLNQIGLLPPETNPCQISYVTANGVIATCSTTTTPRSFLLKCDQYLPIIKSSTPCSLSCIIPDTNRWKKTHIPQENTPVTVSGTLNTINRDATGAAISFTITLDSLSFPPRGFIPPQQVPHAAPSSSAGTKTGFRYADVNKKRKLAEEKPKSD